jgi:histidine ammonia-lyase
MRRRCLTLLAHVEAATVPAEWARQEPRLAAEADHLRALLSSPDAPAVYGANTLVGHLSDQAVPPEHLAAFQMELIRNHALGSAPFYGDWENRCISYARAHFFSLGGSGISPKLYRLVREAAADPAFRPKVPRGCSYSCGDVIPAAHWALALTKRLKAAGYVLRPKEGLALLNGVFVHVGLALALLRPLRRAWRAFLLASRLSARLCRANASNYTPALTDDAADPVRRLADLVRPEAQDERQPGQALQDPISLRAFPQAAAALAQALAWHLDSLDQALARRSDNPLVVAACPVPLSQASFLAPLVTLATGQLVDAWMMVAWMVERRTHYLLSGKVPGLPEEARTGPADLGLIQLPKLMTAVLEEMRSSAARRSFASGSSTSYGLEDFWTYGVVTADVLAGVLEQVYRLLAMELAAQHVCLTAFFPKSPALGEFAGLEPGDGPPAQRIERLRQQLAERDLPGEVGYPFE